MEIVNAKMDFKEVFLVIVYLSLAVKISITVMENVYA